MNWHKLKQILLFQGFFLAIGVGGVIDGIFLSDIVIFVLGISLTSITVIVSTSLYFTTWNDEEK